MTLAEYFENVNFSIMSGGTIYVIRRDWFEDDDAEPANYEEDGLSIEQVPPFYMLDGGWENGYAPEPEDFVPVLPSAYLDAEVYFVTVDKTPYNLSPTSRFISDESFCGDIVIAISNDDEWEDWGNDDKVNTFKPTDTNIECMKKITEYTSWPYEVSKETCQKADAVLSNNKRQNITIRFNVFDFISNKGIENVRALTDDDIQNLSSEKERNVAAKARELLGCFKTIREYDAYKAIRTYIYRDCTKIPMLAIDC